jgi:hypothetical protein
MYYRRNISSLTATWLASAHLPRSPSTLGVGRGRTQAGCTRDPLLALWWHTTRLPRTPRPRPCAAPRLRCDIEQPGGMTKLKFAQAGTGPERRIVLSTIESDEP